MLRNPRWPEILGSLRQGQQPSDRYDVVCRVFRLKFADLLSDIRSGALGKQIAFMYTVEWQKRGLPHVHMLVWLAAEDKMRSPSDYDQVVCAEFPDVVVEPELHALVMDHMVHVPCVGFNDRAPCIVDGKCTKRYPRKMQYETVEDGDGYPLYRRRCRRRYAYPKGGMLVDDRNVVPYNRALLHRWTGSFFRCLCYVVSRKFFVRFLTMFFVVAGCSSLLVYFSLHPFFCEVFDNLCLCGRLFVLTLYFLLHVVLGS